MRVSSSGRLLAKLRNFEDVPDRARFSAKAGKWVDICSRSWTNVHSGTSHSPFHLYSFPKIMNNKFLAMCVAGLTALSGGFAQQKTVTIAVVNNPDMIRLKKLSSKLKTRTRILSSTGWCWRRTFYASKLQPMCPKAAANLTWSISACTRHRFLPSAAD